jgi:hypothetical protein
VSFKAGDVQTAQGGLADALKSYNDSLAVRDQLAKSASSNAGWQRDPSVSYEMVGDVLMAQSDLVGALTRKCLRLTGRSPKRTPWPRGTGS